MSNGKATISIAILTVLITGCSFLTASTADTEENDDFTTAEEITEGYHPGSIDPMDPSDTYRFSINPGDVIVIDIAETDSFLNFTLYDVDKVRLAYLDDPISGQKITYQTDSERSRYKMTMYLVVLNNHAMEVGEYEFGLSFIGQNEGGTDGDAPGGQQADYWALNITEGGYEGRLFEGGSDEWHQGEDGIDAYKFLANGSEVVNITFTSDAPENLTLTLFENQKNIFILNSSNGDASSSRYFTSGKSYKRTWNILIEQVTMPGNYSFTLRFDEQNDAGLGTDAPKEPKGLTNLSAGTYTGFLSDEDTTDTFGLSPIDGGSIIELEVISESSDPDATLLCEIYESISDTLIRIEVQDGQTEIGRYVTMNESVLEGLYIRAFCEKADQAYRFKLSYTPQNDAGSGDDANSFDAHDPSFILKDGNYTGILGDEDNSDTFSYHALPSMVIEAEFTAVDDYQFNELTFYDSESNGIMFLRSNNNTLSSNKRSIDGDIEPFLGVVSVYAKCEYSFGLHSWFQDDSGSGRDAYSKDTDLIKSTPIISGNHTGYLGSGDTLDNFRIPVPANRTLKMTVDPDSTLTVWPSIMDLEGKKISWDNTGGLGDARTLSRVAIDEGEDIVISLMALNGWGYYTLDVEILSEEGPGNETVPGPPRNLVATVGIGGIDLKWDPPLDDGGSPIIFYKVWRANGLDGPFSLLSTAYSTNWSDESDILPGQTYYYQISALNAIGEGENSTVISAKALITGNDTDKDGLPDEWEDLYGLDKDNSTDAAMDKDGDGHTSIEEYLAGSDPTSSDSTPLDIDGDGLPNEWEDLYALDKYDPSDAEMDEDGDGFSNMEEYAAGTNPTNGDVTPLDLDGDGLPNDWEDLHGLNKTYPNDALYDPDGDGRNNLKEYQDGTDPRVSDVPEDEGEEQERDWVWYAVCCLGIPLAVIVLAIITLMVVSASRRRKAVKDEE